MIGHELHRSGSFWSFLLSIDKDLADSTRQKGCSCGGRLHSANYRGYRGAGRIICRRSIAGGSASAVIAMAAERGCAAIGPFSRQKGLPWCRGGLGQRDAARSNAAPSTRPFDPVWC